MKKDEKQQPAARQPEIEYDWPLPPYFKLLPKVKLKGAEAESCFIIMKEGPRRVGNLTQFSPSASSLIFTLDQASSSASVAFEEIQSMCLTDIVELIPVNLSESGNNDAREALIN